MFSFPRDFRRARVQVDFSGSQGGPPIAPYVTPIVTELSAVLGVPEPGEPWSDQARCDGGHVIFYAGGGRRVLEFSTPDARVVCTTHRSRWRRGTAYTSVHAARHDHNACFLLPLHNRLLLFVSADWYRRVGISRQNRRRGSR